MASGHCSSYALKKTKVTITPGIVLSTQTSYSRARDYELCNGRGNSVVVSSTVPRKWFEFLIMPSRA